ncbi:MAG TPA: hypothetical protein VGS10_11280 [Terracidiphilus sp.]|nr:hypothetical protein [Terracidiphilus sp.]
MGKVTSAKMSGITDRAMLTWDQKRDAAMAALTTERADLRRSRITIFAYALKNAPRDDPISS